MTAFFPSINVQVLGGAHIQPSAVTGAGTPRIVNLKSHSGHGQRNAKTRDYRWLRSRLRSW